ncbi:hypothetical protein B5181_27200 [Streptomyces sp. 4F]|nr:hypothetical protein B5181_27200 [Streptomyces sp. 4F]
MVREADIPAVTTEHLTHLRPTLDIEEPYMRLILAYLGSGALDYRARGVGGLAHISIRDIADMRLPDRDDMLTEALAEIVKAGGELRQ